MRHFRRLVVLAAVLAISFLGVQTGQAQQGASGLQISPTKHEISIEPGEVKQVSFIIKNITNIEIKAKVRLNDFESDNLTGQPVLIVDTTKRSDHSLDKFLKGLEDIDLKVGESKEVKITVDVPSDAAPGGYFGAIRFDATPKDGRPDQAREIALTASVAPLLLVQVNGAITEQIQIEKLVATKNDKASKFFVSPPNKAALTIKNVGNGFSRPFGRVTVQNMTNKEVFSYELNNTDPRGNVLPGSVRTFTNDISGFKMPGRYRITASVAHGNGGEVINYSSFFWYIPIWFIVIILTLLGAAAGLYFMVRRRRDGKHVNRNKK